MKWILRAKKFTYPENSIENRSARGQRGSPYVFLDHSRTKAQRRPNRLTRRAEHVLNEIEKGELPESRVSIVADTENMQVSRGTQLAGFVHEGRWHWTDEMVERFREKKVDPLGAKAEIEQSF